jgi:SAM-dependent methyltransferase
VTLDDPELVRREYESERGLALRRALWKTAVGLDPRNTAFDAVAEASPTRILEVGSGPGELSARLDRELGADVIAIDLSPRMVDLACRRGVDARLGDVQDLQFADETFDCVLAAWMLYHVPDLDRGLAELARVLRPGGRLVAVTNGETNLSELWSLLGADAIPRYTFSCENAAESLERHFARVERRDVIGTVTIPTRADAHRYVSATLIRPELADELPRDGWPLELSRAQCVFVATKADA